METVANIGWSENEKLLSLALHEYTTTVKILANMTWGKELDCKQVSELLNDHNKRIKGISVPSE